MNRPCSEKSYIDDYGEALELDEAWFAKASRGRPKLSSELRKQRHVALRIGKHLAQLTGEAGGLGENEDYC